jgi:hypothetical protein
LWDLGKCGEVDMFGEKAVLGFAVTLLVLLQILGLGLSFWVVGAYGCLMGVLFVLEGGIVTGDVRIWLVVASVACGYGRRSV